jgi:hypothetical protein
MTLVREGGDELLWVSDPGFVFAVKLDDGDEEWAPVFGKGVHVETRPPRVVKMTLAGKILVELPLPPAEPESPSGMMGDYCPCGTAVDEERFGGTGDVWVADGYGSSLDHRFDKRRNHQLTLTGEEGGGRFLCPHVVFIDRRGGKTPELYIADRESKRVQVYDLYRRTFGTTFLNSPSGFAVSGDLLVVAELYSRLAVVGVEDNFVGGVGASESSRSGVGRPELPGWLNALSGDARVVRPDMPVPHEFSSLHSLATDADGNQSLCLRVAHRRALHEAQDLRVNRGSASATESPAHQTRPGAPVRALLARCRAATRRSERKSPGAALRENSPPVPLSNGNARASRAWPRRCGAAWRGPT